MEPTLTPLSVADTPAWAELTAVIDRADGKGERYSAEDLAEELAEDGVAPERDTWGLRDGDALVAFGQVRVRPAPLDGRAVALLEGGVHPDRRGRGIGRALMEVMERRARDLAAERHPGLPVTLRNPGGRDTDPVRGLLARRGFTISRYFIRMSRDLPDAGAGAPTAVDGFRVAGFDHRLSARTLRARNAAFADHWGATATTPSGWEDLVTARSFTAASSFVAIAPPGAEGAEPEVASFCLAQDWQDGPLYLALIGTVPAARGRGLARACIDASLTSSAGLRHADGAPRYTGVELHVDADSPTGATRLYEAAGFTATATYATFTREVPALP